MRRLPLITLLLLGLVLRLEAADDKWSMTAVVSSNAVMVRVDAPPVVNDELLKLLRTGVSISLRYQFELYAKSGIPIYIFPLKTVGWTKTLEYDMAADIYVLTSPAGVIKDDSLRDIIEVFYRPDFVPVCGGSLADYRARYWTRGRARLETIKLYPPLSLIFGLIDIYNFTTPWMEPEVKLEK